MDTLSPSMRDLAQKLLAASLADSDPRVHVAVRMCEMLGASVRTLAGVDGFAALMGRALALAGEEVPSLQNIKIRADGCPEGFERTDTTDSVAEGRRAAVALTAHLLGLLVTFIGEPLTLRLVREAWPDVSLDDWHSRTEVDG